jgi:hypothetical protein
MNRNAGNPPIGSRTFSAAMLLAAGLLLAGCTSVLPNRARMEQTRFDRELVELPVRVIGNLMVVESAAGRDAPLHFLLDTGASTTMVSSELSQRLGLDDDYPAGTPQVVTRSPDGRTSLLQSTRLRRLELGDVAFDDVPALIYDFSELSSHLGVRIDGLLGFPLFSQTLLTLDYPHSRVVIAPNDGESALPPSGGGTVDFNNDQRVPIIPIRIGDRSIVALIDSGSDAVISLNPVGLELDYLVLPRMAGPVATVTGPRDQMLGRLDGLVQLAGHNLENPIIETTEDLSAIGGAALRNFSITFDQLRNQATFVRENTAPIRFEPQRSTGLAFNRTPAYWRVAAVIPGSPAASAGVAAGELVTRIDDEPVSAWNVDRFEQRLRTGRDIAFTFLIGRVEQARTISVYELVP